MERAFFFEDAINNLFKDGYPGAINELDLEVIDSPAAEFSEIGKGKPMTITITVPVYPVVEVKDYFGVEGEQVEAKVKPEDVEKEIEGLQKRNARMILADRPVKEGDTVLLDYSGFCGRRTVRRRHCGETGTEDRFRHVHSWLRRAACRRYAWRKRKT